MKIILPKTFFDTLSIDSPVFFIAGPSLGGGDWQHECATKLRKKMDDFYAAIPCRYEEAHPLQKFKVTGKEDYFPRQIYWERFYLERAADPAFRLRGCLLFWLPCQSKTEPRKDGSPYARDTYGELGEWRGRMMAHPNLRVVIGAEPEFPGLSQIKCNFDEALKLNFTIHSTLDETIEAAVAKAAV